MVDHMTTNDPTTTIDTHLAGYAEPDRTKRDELIAAAWTRDGVLADPPFDGTGHAGIADMVDVLLTHYPDHHFERTTDLDTHHDHARYRWALVGPDGTKAVEGTDFAEFAADGRLVRIVGFFGDLAPAAA